MIEGLLLGAVVGITMGLTGAGGGILAVPLLVFGMHLSVVEAGPIGLFAVGVSAAVGALIGLRSRIVRYRAALLIASSGVLLAPAGVWLAHRLDTRLLSLLFAVVLIWVAFRSFRQSSGHSNPLAPIILDRPCMRDDMSGHFIWTSKCVVILSIAGTLAGFLSGLLGVGGGFVMVPVLQRYTDLETQSIIATSLAVIALVSIVGVATSMSVGHLNINVALPFAAGSVAGLGVGKVLTGHLSQKYLKTTFAVVCLGVAMMMIVRSL